MIFKCFICNKELNKNGIGSHLRGCSKINNINLNKNELMIKLYEKNLNISISKEFIYEYYINKQYSLPDFLKEFNFQYSFTQNLLIFYDIPKRSLKEANSLNVRQDKYKKTCLKKYGVENVSKINNIKEKKKQTFLKNYGIDNIRKSTDFRLWLNDHMFKKYGQYSVPNINNNANYFGWKTTSKEEKQERISKLKIYGKEWYENLSSEEKINISTRLGRASKNFWNNISQEEKDYRIYNLLKSSFKGPRSKLEIKLIEVLEELEISYKRHHLLENKEYDILINDTNILIEIHGDYWHANPIKYKENDIIKYPGKGEVLVQDIWKKDIFKNELAKSYGFNIIYIWEYDINKTKNLTEFISDILIKEGIKTLNETCEN